MKTVEGGVTSVKGFTASGIYGGIKKNGHPDLALLFSETPCTVAGVFTKNRFKAPPLRLCQKHLQGGLGQAVIVNSGNANAFTGKRGLQDAEAMGVATAAALSIPGRSVFVASTGVIGEFLPIERVKASIPELVSHLSRTGGAMAAEAIMTTDTFLKEVAVVGRIGRHSVRVGGMAKGSGMIHPNMATMLGFLTTDISISSRLLQESLREAVDGTFNCITVDGETSTNDMVLCFANGRSNEVISKKGAELNQFISFLRFVCLSLAKMIVQDGEGATKMIRLDVIGAKDDRVATRVAKMIACSSLVKTAFFGEDANWGRIVAAIGNANVPVDPDKIDLIFFGDSVAQDAGDKKARDPRDGIALLRLGAHQGREAELKISALLKRREIHLLIDLHSGKGKTTVWTSDLSLDYVKINAAYRT